MQANQNVETTVRVLIGTLPANARTRLVRELAVEMAPALPDSNRIMRRGEASKVLGRTVRAIDMLAQQGQLQWDYHLMHMRNQVLLDQQIDIGCINFLLPDLLVVVPLA